MGKKNEPGGLKIPEATLQSQQIRFHDAEAHARTLCLTSLYFLLTANLLEASTFLESARKFRPDSNLTK